MPEISLNILDVTENSVRAHASLIRITVAIDEKADTLSVTIADNGCGMDEAQLGQLGAWQKEAVLAARLAPSAINQQPWKIVADKTSVSILETTVLYKKYAPLDRGICMLHAAVGAAKAGRTGLWKKVDGGYAMKA